MRSCSHPFMRWLSIRKGCRPVEAASIWMMFVTAYGALIDDAKITSQDAVVIPGASSSVGLAAIQIANSVGAKSIALTRTSAKRKQLIDAGAKYVIATEEEDLVKEINEITGGQGARVVFDPVGGPTLLELIKAMSFQGILYLYGALSDQATTVPPLALIAKILTIKGHNIWVTSGNPERQKAAVDFVINGLEKAHAETNRRQSLSIRQDRRCAPLSRSERADRQDRRHDLIRQGRLGRWTASFHGVFKHRLEPGAPRNDEDN